MDPAENLCAPRKSVSVSPLSLSLSVFLFPSRNKWQIFLWSPEKRRIFDEYEPRIYSLEYLELQTFLGRDSRQKMVRIFG